MNVLLGSNVINDCDAALYVNGKEVFRLREGVNDGQLYSSVISMSSLPTESASPRSRRTKSCTWLTASHTTPL